MVLLWLFDISVLVFRGCARNSSAHSEGHDRPCLSRDHQYIVSRPREQDEPRTETCRHALSDQFDFLPFRRLAQLVARISSSRRTRLCGSPYFKAAVSSQKNVHGRTRLSTSMRSDQAFHGSLVHVRPVPTSRRRNAFVRQARRPTDLNSRRQRRGSLDQHLLKRGP